MNTRVALSTQKFPHQDKEWPDAYVQPVSPMLFILLCGKLFQGIDVPDTNDQREAFSRWLKAYLLASVDLSLNP